MAKTNLNLHYTLFSWGSVSESAHLDTLWLVTEYISGGELVKVIRNAFNAGMVLQFRSMVSLRRNLAVNKYDEYHKVLRQLEVDDSRIFGSIPGSRERDTKDKRTLVLAIE